MSTIQDNTDNTEIWPDAEPDMESGGEYNLENEENIPEDVNDGEELPEESEDDNDKDGNSAANPLKLLFGMMFNPVEGWKKIRRSRLSTDAVGRGCFFPLLGLLAISCFAPLIYEETATLNSCTMEAVKMFVALFFGYYLVLALERTLMPLKFRQTLAGTDFGKCFVMYCLSTLAIFLTIYEALPMVQPVVVFLPIWTIYLAARGARFFKFPEEKNGLLTTMVCIYLLGAPLCIWWALDWLLIL